MVNNVNTNITIINLIFDIKYKKIKVSLIVVYFSIKIIISTKYMPNLFMISFPFPLSSSLV